MSGLRLKLYINEDLLAGTKSSSSGVFGGTAATYRIEINGLRNPDHFDHSFYKWVFEVCDVDMKTIVARSFSTSSNYLL